MRNASRAQPGALPKSLIRRLDLLQVGILPVSAPKPTARARRLAARAKRLRIGAVFGLGLAGGGVLGCAALLILLVQPEPGSTRDAWALADGAASPASSALPPDAPVVAAAAAPNSAAAAVEPAARAAPLPPILEAPFRTEVIAAPSPPPSPAAEDAAKASWPAEVRAAEAEVGDEPGVGPASRGASPQRPLGLSALGGPQGDQPATTQVGRTLWWRMPAPAWTPFDSGLSPN